MNLKSRRDYIEPEYVDGVCDENGKRVIRPLNEEEKAWLNKFYQETIITTFKRDGSDLYTEDEDRKAFYRENNKRNTCLYNKLKKTGMLFSIERINLDMVRPELGTAYDPENILLSLQEYGVKTHEELLALIEKEEENLD